MKKKYYILILLVLCIFVTLIGIGCGTPEGFDSDLWRDSKKVVKIIQKTYNKKDNFSVKDEEFIDKYFETYKGRIYDNPQEDQLIYDIEDLYVKCQIYTLSLSDKSQDCIEWDKRNVEESFKKLKDNYDNLL